MENRRAPWRIAIADDSPAFLAAAAGYIGSLPGCILAGTATSALEALALVEAVTPDLLLLDLGIAPARGRAAWIGCGGSGLPRRPPPSSRSHSSTATRRPRKPKARELPRCSA